MILDRAEWQILPQEPVKTYRRPETPSRGTPVGGAADYNIFKNRGPMSRPGQAGNGW